MSPTDLRILPDATDPALAQQQARFNTLVEDLATWRAALAGWKDRMDRYWQVLGPVHRELHAAWRQWVFALDEASLDPALSRAERAQLRELLRDTATQLLAQEDDDAIAALLRRHADDAPAAAPEPLPEQDEPLASDDPPDWEQQAAQAAARRAQASAQRRADGAARRRQQAQREVSQSLRDVYRRLASALHPDREQDPLQRERKTALMQQANEAYSQENLLVLLELQLQAEQIDAARAGAVDPRRLQHYVTVLQEQLTDLQAETRRLESAFRAAVGLPPGTGLQPRKADRTLSAQAQRLRGDLQAVQAQARMLRDVEQIRDWLRAVRRA